eukprot:6352380-Alexandrium_andersonii.AAC.1
MAALHGPTAGVPTATSWRAWLHMAINRIDGVLAKAEARNGDVMGGQLDRAPEASWHKETGVLGRGGAMTAYDG